jgi:hypothetical protein
MIRIARAFILELVYPMFRRHHFFKLFGRQWCIGPDRLGWKVDGNWAFYISNNLRDIIYGVPDWKNN